MALAGTAAITELWAKAKQFFAHSATATTTSTTASIQLKDGNGDNLGSAASIPAATTSAAGVMTADDRTKLNGIATGANNYTHPSYTAASAAAIKVGRDATGHVVTGSALTYSDVGAAASSHSHSSYVNQNAFSNVAVGSTTIAADSATDTLTLVAGSNISLTADATNDRVTIAATDTTYGLASRTANGLMSKDDYSIINDALLLLDGYQDESARLTALDELTDPAYSQTETSGMLYWNASTGHYTLTQDNYSLRNSDFYVATCSTAAGTAAKVATVINSQAFTLATGAMVLVRFTMGNTSTSTPTLNINSTGAKNIGIPLDREHADEPTVYTTHEYYNWGAHEAVLFVYSGSTWMMMGSGRCLFEAYTTASTALAGLTDGSVTKVGTATKGSTTKPIYLSSGAPAECSTYAGGTAVTLNGTSKAASTASFYAPTGAGTSGYYLMSNGSGAPSWTAKGSVASGNSYLVDGGTVYTAIQSAMGDVAGALVYKGTLGTGGTVTSLPASHTKGWYYVVLTAGTYAGQTCEPGDMVICHAAGTTASDADWDVVQTNIVEMTAADVDAICV